MGGVFDGPFERDSNMGNGEICREHGKRLLILGALGKLVWQRNGYKSVFFVKICVFMDRFALIWLEPGSYEIGVRRGSRLSALSDNDGCLRSHLLRAGG